MVRTDLELLQFAVKWAPYDGGNEHVLVEFGLSLSEYYRRLQNLLNASDLQTVAGPTRIRLQELCAQHLQTRPSPARHRPSSGYGGSGPRQAYSGARIERS